MIKNFFLYNLITHFKNKKMQTLQINPEKARLLYPTASPEFKAMLEDTFGKDFFNQKIYDRINSMADIFSIGGKKLEDIVSPNDTKDEAAYKVLKFGIKVFNEGVKVDHSNSNQTKYEPRFYWKAGVGLSYYYCDYWHSHALVGPALCYLDYACMLKGVKVMEKWYSDYMNQ